MAFTTKNLFSSATVNESAGDSYVREDSENPRVTWKFTITGASDADAARTAVYSHLSNLTGNAGLPLDSVTISKTDSDSVYTAEVVYAERQQSDSDINEEEYVQPEIQDLDYSFSTTGGSRHLTHSFQTLFAVTSDGSTARNFGCGIGWNGEGFDGVDVVAPKLEFSISVNWPKTHFTQTMRLTLAAATGSINSAAWNGFGAGCVLFKGVSAQPVAFDNEDGERDYYWRATYQFEAQQAQTIPIGNSSVTKRGYDYVWRVVEQYEGTGGLEASVAQLNIERVYQEFDFDNLGLPFPE